MDPITIGIVGVVVAVVGIFAGPVFAQWLRDRKQRKQAHASSQGKPSSQKKATSPDQAKAGPEPPYDVFLSHSHANSEWAEELARKLQDEFDFRVWLDKWILVPGKSWQQEMAKGLNDVPCCVVCINQETPQGWFSQEIELALDLQSKDENFRVIPLLLPHAEEEAIPDFLRLRTWVDFREEKDHDYAFHVLTQGIRGRPVGRWPLKDDGNINDDDSSIKEKLSRLQSLKAHGLRDEVEIEFQRELVSKWLDEDK